MSYKQSFFTKNECYITGRPFKPSGVCLHSTGVNNPHISRYVPAWNVCHPGGKDIGYHRFVRDPKTGRCAKCGGRQVCVHGFLGKEADGSVGFVQTMPWNRPSWHCGGSANKTHVGFEICEDGLNDPAYFNACYNMAVGIVADMCKQYSWNPLDPKIVTCHSEAHRMGWASNHADVEHWFKRFGKTMDGFRKDVSDKMKPEPKKEENDMTDAEVRKIVRDEYETMRKKDNEAKADWENEFMGRAKKMGLMDGTRPKAYITRGEVATMFCNFVDYLVDTIGKALK